MCCVTESFGMCFLAKGTSFALLGCDWDCVQKAHIFRIFEMGGKIIEKCVMGKKTLALQIMRL